MTVTMRARISIRAYVSDADRVDELTEALPFSRAVLVREALKLGLDLIERDPGVVIRGLEPRTKRRPRGQ